MEREDLRAAEAHIARLEDELLRLKDANRDLQKLREEHQRLRRSIEGRFVKLLTLPWRMFRRRKTAGAAVSGYEQWLASHRIAPSEIKTLQQQAHDFSYSPLMSILMPTFNSNEQFLAEAIESVRGQVYERWELIAVDDASDDPGVRRRLQHFAECDRRVRVFFEGEHRGISAALNVALSRANGEWIALLDHDDLLEVDALFRVVELLQSDREAHVIYSDEDKIIDGHCAAPMLKPDWSPELFLSHDYVGHFLAIRRDMAGNGFRSEFDGAQDYELLFRISEQTNRIRHIPRVLYHWRRTAQSTAHNIRRKPGALEAGRRAIDQHLVRTGTDGYTSIDWETHAYRVRFDGRCSNVSVFLLGGSEHEAKALLTKTAHEKIQLIISGAVTPSANCREYMLFIDHDLEPTDCHWLAEMAAQLKNRQVGAVGARILNRNDTIETAGYVLLPDGTARPAFNGFPDSSSGVNRQLKVVRNYSAVTASCLLTRREVFEHVIPAGTDWFVNLAQAEPVCAGVEYCLNLREAGFRVVITPYAMMRRRSPPASAVGRCPQLANRWPDVFRRDPFYNPNFALKRADFAVVPPTPE